MRIIGYLTSGYPSIEKCEEMAGVYIDGGCDMLEISLPLYDNREKPFLAGIMREAITLCPDYDEHLASIGRIANANRGVDITILLYNEVLLEIGAEKFVRFCGEYGIKDVNSANLSDPETMKILNKNGIRIAGLITYSLEDDRVQAAKEATGFIYCQAFPREGQQLKKGCETLGGLIDYIRHIGISNDIYCGGGIAGPEDALKVKEAGADGFFLGTSIIALYDEPQKLRETIASFKRAVTQK